MKERDERHTIQAAKPAKPASEEERRLLDAIEDDEVREALGVPHQHKPVTQGAG
jgi:hypothetical protein